ncbi:MAG: hypothetical protein ATN36_07840 [Epulopiscium sp. Nele67-Bin005]|nr:MAG: hypothetical protein ATN36_07840 [Epulopiscium sp. Nele67-Bin005]
MSMSNIPDITPNISLTKDEAVNLILASIGMEGLSLAHLLNAEAEKVQYALGTLSTANDTASSLEEILDTNASVNTMLRDVIKQQLLLSLNLEDLLDYAGIVNDTALEEPEVGEPPITFPETTGPETDQPVVSGPYVDTSTDSTTDDTTNNTTTDAN